jgi:hypothetical protein
LAISLAFGAVALAGEPGLDVHWSVNGNQSLRLLPAGKDLGDGTYVYDGAHHDPVTGLVLYYSFTGTTHPTPALAGHVNLFNFHLETVEIAVEANFTPGNSMSEESLLKGFGVVGLTTGEGGGMVTSSPPWLLQTLIDSEPVGIDASMFYHPFQMGTSGAGQASAFDEFGVLEPAVGPPVQESIGMRMLFTISDSDSVAVTNDIVVVNCSADLDGDGAVSTIDLTILLVEWGPCGAGCAADLDGNGVVSTEDLLMLLEAWGPCPTL